MEDGSNNSISCHVSRSPNRVILVSCLQFKKNLSHDTFSDHYTSTIYIVSSSDNKRWLINSIYAFKGRNKPMKMHWCSTTLNWAVGKLAIIEWMIWFMLHKFSPGLLTDSISIDIDPSFRLFRAFMTPATCAAEIGLLLEHAATEISRDSLGMQHLTADGPFCH